MYVSTILNPVMSTTLYPRPKFQINPPFKNTLLENPTNDIAQAKITIYKNFIFEIFFKFGNILIIFFLLYS